MDTTEHNDETPAEQPRADRWELAPEPEPGTVVQDRNGMVWVRDADARTWLRGGSNRAVAPWSTVLSGAPLVRLVPAPKIPDADLRRVTDERDQARAHVRRYLGTPALRDAAKALVMAEAYNVDDVRRGELVSRLRAALDTAETEPPQAPDDVARRWRTERDEARERYSTLRANALASMERVLDSVMPATRMGQDVRTHDRDAILERAATTSDRHRKAVVSAARRVLDAVDNGMPADDVDGPIVKLRATVAAMDRYQSLAERCLTETRTD